jgi:hypothetical protein
MPCRHALAVSAQRMEYGIPANVYAVRQRVTSGLNPHGTKFASVTCLGACRQVLRAADRQWRLRGGPCAPRVIGRAWTTPLMQAERSTGDRDSLGRRAHLGVRACACRAMASCTAGRMTRSAVPATAQDGMVFQAGTPLFWLSAMVDSGSAVAASTRASLSGRPLAKQARNSHAAAAAPRHPSSRR